jgi:predicted DCC family thiol-disulfide oxidoreductase YuxK
VLTRPVLIYDGNCAFCRAWVDRIRRWDRRNTIELMPAAERFRVRGLPPLSDAQLDAAMHFVLSDGRVLSGGRAIPELLRLLPGGRLPRLLFHLPGVQRLADVTYGWVARRRHRFGCGNGACGVG